MQGPRFDPRLYEDATPLQIECLDAVVKHGSYRAADTARGAAHSSTRNIVDRMLKKAARDGIAPGHFESGVAPGYLMGKVTVQRNCIGDVERTWERQSPDASERFASIIEAIDARVDRIAPRLPVLADFTIAPRGDLLNVLTITDAHVGAMAWHREGGADWDLKIAKETLTRVFCGMIRKMPSAHKIIVNQLGDFLHTDGLKAITPGHGHLLDADGRFPKLAAVGVEILEAIVECALDTHEKVHIIMAEGNHDEASSSWLRILFQRLFRDDPRVTVEDTPLPYYAYEHGEVMLAFHHGHKLKPEQLPIWFAEKYARMWGRCNRRFGHSGHRHHLAEKDFTGMRWLQHPTLAANDAHGSRSGYISPREAIGITYDLTREVSRIYETPEMFLDA